MAKYCAFRAFVDTIQLAFPLTSLEIMILGDSDAEMEAAEKLKEQGSAVVKTIKLIQTPSRVDYIEKQLNTIRLRIGDILRKDCALKIDLRPSCVLTGPPTPMADPTDLAAKTFNRPETTGKETVDFRV